MESINSNDTFQIAGNPGELITSSVFNFLCYYELNTNIMWNFTLMPTNSEIQDPDDECKATIDLTNTNYITSYEIMLKRVENTS